MAIPPLEFGKKQSSSSRRMTYVLRDYWEEVKGQARAFPPEAEIIPAHLEDIWKNCFIVEANNSSMREDYKYKYLGQSIIKAYGADLTGMQPGALVSPQASQLEEAYEKVLAIKSPVFSSGKLTNAKNQEVRYRQILLPLGNDGVNITAILGGMTYRLY